VRKQQREQFNLRGVVVDVNNLRIKLYHLLLHHFSLVVVELHGRSWPWSMGGEESEPGLQESRGTWGGRRRGRRGRVGRDG